MSADAFTIIYETTENDFNGKPLPPVDSDYLADDYWTEVRSLDGGFTRWRRIVLNPITNEREALS